MVIGAGAAGAVGVGAGAGPGAGTTGGRSAAPLVASADTPALGYAAVPDTALAPPKPGGPAASPDVGAVVVHAAMTITAAMATAAWIRRWMAMADQSVLRSLQARLTAPTGGLVAPDFLGPARKQEKEPPVALMEEGSTGAGETLEVVSSVSYDAQGNVMTAEQVAAQAAAAAEAKAAADAAAAQAAAEAAAADAAAAAAATAAAAAAAAAPVERTYTVVKGDTLSAIGKKFGVNWRDIASLNQVKNPDLIHPGQVFRIPN